MMVECIYKAARTCPPVCRAPTRSTSWHYYLRKKNRDNQKVPLSSSLCLLLARFPRRTHVTCGPRGLACFALRGSGRGRKIFSDLADWIAMSLSTIHLLPPFFYPFFFVWKDYLLYCSRKMFSCWVRADCDSVRAAVTSR